MSTGLAVAFPLALGAALLHAWWNVLLKTSRDPLQVSTVAVLSGMIVATPFALLAWALTGRPGLPLIGWLLVGASAILELGYFIFLSEAYRRGDLSLVYPIARGTAPLLTVPIGLVALHEHLARIEVVGILLMLAGIWAVRRPARTGNALLPALLTGITIAAYSAVDRVGVRLTDAWVYGWALGTMTAIVLLLWATLKVGWSFRELLSVSAPASKTGGTGNIASQQPSGFPPGFLGWPLWRATLVGVLMITAWMLILVALAVAPLSVVSPLRESAIVLVTGWAIWRLREGRGMWLRLGGALFIVFGAVLLVVQ